MSSLLPYALYSVNAFKWKTTFFVCKHILILMNLYSNSLFGFICMCAGDIYMCVCVRIRVCVTYIRVYTHTWTLHVYMYHAFTCWCSLCMCVCVLPSEMEYVLFYCRKIAHRAVICCIMYPTLNKFCLILSYLLSYLICKISRYFSSVISYRRSPDTFIYKE